ncbi:conserved hypothetical protein [Sporisorium reilianum SRZ2]|uniref:Uncharacterized protein n=1 Tax=Sporisorium reilianum (strain SRZ2) TaxID=999809 RepID=E6ZWA8_SPORE|nr:conserved hypothetical protein [Sporisorium reilianum SRZ2]
MHAPRLVFHLLLLFALLQLASCARGSDRSPAPPSSGSEYNTANADSVPSTSSSLSTPATARTARTAGSAPMPNYMVYDDEDASAANMAWLSETMDQNKVGQGRWKYIDYRLKHPSVAYRAAKTPPVAKEEEGKEKGFVFGAKPEGEADVDVPVERVSGDLTDTRAVRFRGDDSPRVDVGSGSARGRRRFRELDLRRGGRARGRTGQTSRTPVTLAAAPDAAVDDASRAKSPTRFALESAAEQLKALQLDAQSQQAPISAARRGSSSQPPTARGAHTPPASSTWTANTGAPNTPPRGTRPLRPVLRVPPLRMWDARTALAKINVRGHARLSNVPAANAHWRTTVDALGEHDWSKQLLDRLFWAGEHRAADTRPARVVTPFGGVIGSDVTSSPRFVYDANDPPPRLDSLEQTGTHKRIYAWHTLAHMIPPPLTAHSQGVWDEHHDSDYANVPRDTHDSVHPIQYTSQLLRDRNGGVVLENALHESMFAKLHNPPASVRASLLRKVGRRGRDRDAPIEELLGTEWAMHKPFSHPWYHDKAPTRIKNPLDVPLTKWKAFADYADAVALRPV